MNAYVRNKRLRDHNIELSMTTHSMRDKTDVDMLGYLGTAL